MASHKHWPKDHPHYDAAPVCDLPTKKACDERWREKRGEAVRFSKEDWEAKQAAEAVARAARIEAAYEEHNALH